MHTPLLYAATVAVVTAGWLALTAYQFDRDVRSFGSYPHDIALDGTYWDKARYTVTDRLAVPRTLAFLTGLVFASNAIAVLLVAGVVHIVAG